MVCNSGGRRLNGFEVIKGSSSVAQEAKKKKKPGLNMVKSAIFIVIFFKKKKNHLIIHFSFGTLSSFYQKSAWGNSQSR